MNAILGEEARQRGGRRATPLRRGSRPRRRARRWRSSSPPTWPASSTASSSTSTAACTWHDHRRSRRGHFDSTGNRTLTDLLEERVASAGERTFLVFEVRRRRRLRADLPRVRRAGRALRARARRARRGQGDFRRRPPAQQPGVPDLLVRDRAPRGAVFVPSNVANTVGELEHVVGFTGARSRSPSRVPDVVTRRRSRARQSTPRSSSRAGSVEGRARFDDLPRRPATAAARRRERPTTSPS